MKTFPILVEFPDNFSDVDVLHSIVGNLPINSYEQVGIRFRTNPVLNEQLKERVKELGLLEYVKQQSSKIQS